MRDQAQSHGWCQEANAIDNLSAIQHLSWLAGIGPDCYHAPLSWGGLAWFGIQQVLSQKEWVEFVPPFVTRLSYLSDSTLVVVHGTSLLLASGSIVTGMLMRIGSVLGSLLVLEVTIALVLAGGKPGLIVRDLIILGLAVALVCDSFKSNQFAYPLWRIVAFRHNSKPSAGE